VRGAAVGYVAHIVDPRSEGARPRTWTKTLFPSPTAPADARSFLSDVVGRAEPPSDLEATTLLLSEVVSNAVRHGEPGRPIKLTVTSVDSILRIAVRSEGRFRTPPLRRSEPGGWGLVLLQPLARNWGIEVGSASVETWFEVGV
jgi:anti-sigma regulatory factor (Ser/Thr protein kinase)